MFADFEVKFVIFTSIILNVKNDLKIEEIFFAVMQR